MEFPNLDSFQSKVEEKNEGSIIQNEDNFNKGLKKIGNLRQMGDSTLSKILNSIKKYFMLIVVQISSLMIIGLDKLIKAEFDFTRFLTAEFWYQYITFQVANWIATIVWYMYGMRRILENDSNYLLNVEQIQGFVNVDYNDNFISRQSEIETLIRKKKILELRTKRKLYKLCVKLNIKNYKELSVILSKDRLDIKDRHIRHNYRKLERLNEMLTFDWQLENLKSYRVKDVPMVNYALLTSGFNVTNHEYQFNTYKSSVFSSTVSKVAPSSIITALLMALLLASSFAGKSINLEDLFMFFVQLILIAWNIFSVLSIAYPIFESTHLRSTNERKNDLHLFYNRHKNNNENEKEIIKILEYNN